MRFPWRLCSALVRQFFGGSKVGALGFFGWVELVLLAEGVLPFTCGGAREKRSGLADPACTQETQLDGN